MEKINCILIIDDDPICNYLTKRVCLKMNMAAEVAAFNNSLDALQFISEYAQVHSRCPELILVDIHMPDINGFEFLQKMDAMPLANIEKVVFIGLSASSRPSWKTRYSNFQEFFVKPFTKEKALDILEHHFLKVNQNISLVSE